MNPAYMVILALLGIPTVIFLIVLSVQKLGWKNFFLAIFLLTLTIGTAVGVTLWYTGNFPTEMPTLTMPELNFSWLFTGQTAIIAIVVIITLVISWKVGFGKALGFMWKAIGILIPLGILGVVLLYQDQLPTLGQHLGVSMPMIFIIISSIWYASKKVFSAIFSLLVIGAILLYVLVPNALQQTVVLAEKLAVFYELDWESVSDLIPAELPNLSSNTSETQREPVAMDNSSTLCTYVQSDTGVSINFRSSPMIPADPDENIFNSLLSGTPILILGVSEDGIWMHVQFEQLTGWVHNSVIRQGACE